MNWRGLTHRYRFVEPDYPKSHMARVHGSEVIKDPKIVMRWAARYKAWAELIEMMPPSPRRDEEGDDCRSGYPLTERTVLVKEKVGL